MVDLLSLLESGRNLTMPQSPFRIAVILGRYSGGCTNFGSVTKGERFASCICFERNTRFFVVHGFRKRSRKIPQREIEQTLRRLKEV